MHGSGTCQPEKADDGADQTFGLTEYQTEHGSQGERRQDRQGQAPDLTASGCARRCSPGRDRFLSKPDGQATALA
jgi:hypothetical protein